MNSSLPIWLIWQIIACFAFWLWGIFCVYEKNRAVCIKRVDDNAKGAILYIILPGVSSMIAALVYLFMSETDLIKHLMHSGLRVLELNSVNHLMYSGLCALGIFLLCSVMSLFSLILGIACGIRETDKHIRRKG